MPPNATARLLNQHGSLLLGHRQPPRRLSTSQARLEILQKYTIEFRLLDALLTQAPTPKRLDVIATDISAASAEPDGLAQLTMFYKTGLLLPMKAGGRTPQVSFHPSRDFEIQSEAEAVAVDLDTAKTNPSALKKYTLHRDGYRCVVTGNWEYSSIDLPPVKEEFDPSTDTTTMTEAAQILPFSLMSADPNKKLFKECTIWTVIKSFTNEFTELTGENINSLTNVITLDTSVHRFFGPLSLWFEAVPSNTYKIRKAHGHELRHIVDNGSEVTFTSANPDTLPLPDPRYLVFHAVVAKVVHTAGMAEHLDDILRDHEDIRVKSRMQNTLMGSCAWRKHASSMSSCRVAVRILRTVQAEEC